MVARQWQRLLRRQRIFPRWSTEHTGCIRSSFRSPHFEAYLQCEREGGCITNCYLECGSYLMDVVAAYITEDDVFHWCLVEFITANRTIRGVVWASTYTVDMSHLPINLHSHLSSFTFQFWLQRQQVRRAFSCQWVPSVLQGLGL